MPSPGTGEGVGQAPLPLMVRARPDIAPSPIPHPPPPGDSTKTDLRLRLLCAVPGEEKGGGDWEDVKTEVRTVAYSLAFACTGLKGECQIQVQKIGQWLSG